MELLLLWSVLIHSIIHMLGEIPNRLIVAASSNCICWRLIFPINQYFQHLIINSLPYHYTGHLILHL